MLAIFRFCGRCLLLHKWRLFFYVLLGLFSGAVSAASPYILGDFIDSLAAAEDIGFMFFYFALFGGINIASIAMGYVAARLYVQLQYLLGFAVSRDLIQKIQRQPITCAGQREAAYLSQRITSDSGAPIIFCITIIQSLLVNAVVVVAALVLLFSFNPVLAGILLAVAAVYFFIYLMCRQMLHKANYEYKESQSVYFGKLYEQLAGIRLIKLHSLFSHTISKLDASFRNLFDKALGNQRASYIFGSLDQIVMVAAQMVLLLFGGIEIIAARLTIGGFVVISIYWLLAGKAGEMDRLARMLGLAAHLDGLPDGLGTMLGRGGANLSGGEKQKLSMLGALLRGPDLLVLDEPMSALDERSRGALKDYPYGLNFAEDGEASVVRFFKN